MFPKIHITYSVTIIISVQIKIGNVQDTGLYDKSRANKTIAKRHNISKSSTPVTITGTSFLVAFWLFKYLFTV